MLSAALLSALVAWSPPQPAADDGSPLPLEDFEDRVHAALAPLPGGLTAAEVAREAVVTSPTIEARRAELMARAASVDDTISRFAPDVTATATYSRISQADINFGGGGASLGALNEGPITVAPCADDPMTDCVVDSMGMPVGAQAFTAIEIPLNNYSLGAVLSVPFSDYALRMLPAIRGSRAETEATKYQRDAEKLSVELDARIAYYDWLRALAQVAVAQQTLESTSARLEDARIGEGAGIATSADVLRLDGIVAEAEVGLNTARSFAELAAQNLAVIMGRDEWAFSVGEDVFAPPTPLPDLVARENLIEEALANRLELRALRKSSGAREYARKTAMAAYFPRLDGFADATYANPNQRFFPLSEEWRGSWTVGASLSWRLSAFLQARAQVKQAKASKRLIEANEAAMSRAIRMEVNAAWQEHERALRAIELNERSLSSAEAAYEQQVALYQAGEVTTTDIIDAEARRISATLRDVNARIDLRVASNKLLRATGRMEPMRVPADEADKRYENAGPSRKDGR